MDTTAIETRIDATDRDFLTHMEIAWQARENLLQTLTDATNAGYPPPLLEDMLRRNRSEEQIGRRFWMFTKSAIRSYARERGGNPLPSGPKVGWEQSPDIDERINTADKAFLDAMEAGLAKRKALFDVLAEAVNAGIPPTQLEKRLRANRSEEQVKRRGWMFTRDIIRSEVRERGAGLIRLRPGPEKGFRPAPRLDPAKVADQLERLSGVSHDTRDLKKAMDSALAFTDMSAAVWKAREELATAHVRYLETWDGGRYADEAWSGIGRAAGVLAAALRKVADAPKCEQAEQGRPCGWPLEGGVCRRHGAEAASA